MSNRDPWWTRAPKANPSSGLLKIECPACHALPGHFCIGSKLIHPARREAAYKAKYGTGGEST